jgi:hypothetical protein
MTFEQLANTIRSRFKTQVADTQSLPTQYDNHSFDNPDNAQWCRLTINFGESFQASNGGTGANRFRTPGVMTAQLFTPTGKGDKDILALADVIKTAFRCVTDSGVVFKTPSIKRVGRVKKEWQINVNCPFYADDIG